MFLQLIDIKKTCMIIIFLQLYKAALIFYKDALSYQKIISLVLLVFKLFKNNLKFIKFII